MVARRSPRLACLRHAAGRTREHSTPGEVSATIWRVSALGFDKTRARLESMAGHEVGVWVGSRDGAVQRFQVSGTLCSGTPVNPDSGEGSWNGPGTIRYAFEDLPGWGLLLEPRSFCGAREMADGLIITMTGGLQFVVALG